MFALRHLTLAAAIGLALPSLGFAQIWTQPVPQQAYREGFERGQRAGLQDLRERDAFEFRDESDYRRGDVGYRSQYGDRNRYRTEFRRGFEAGYRAGYRGGPGYDNRVPGRTLPPWANGRGRGLPGGQYSYGPAFDIGYNDGYEAGMKDAQGRRSFDPISEGRYRDGDRGYEREYGAREAYKADYRTAFRQGYEEGYNDARRYDYDRR
jgi:flagellar biosynthesis/type III secretory pathway protein FliH